MPALFAYLIAVALLLGGGYGALNWLATPEPVKVAAKAKPQPPPSSHDADNGGASTQASLSEAAKSQAVSKPEVNATDQVEAASNKAASSDQAPPTASLPQPQQLATAQQPAPAGERGAKAAATAPMQQTAPPQQSDRSARAEMPPATVDQEAGRAEAPAPGTNQDPAKQEKQSAEAAPGAVPPSISQSLASTAPASAATTPKRAHVRQVSRRSEKRPLEVMTLRTIELPDGRRMNQLVPYRGGSLHRDVDPAMAFDPDD